MEVLFVLLCATYFGLALVGVGVVLRGAVHVSWLAADWMAGEILGEVWGA